MSADTIRLRVARLSLTLVMLLFALTACERGAITRPDAVAPAAPGDTAAVQPATAALADVNQQLAALRSLTAHYHDIEDATANGYIAAVTPCLALAGVGAMGVHRGNPEFINDPAVDVLEPELLLYEPQKDGTMRFVGVEYIIPFALRPSTAPAPPLLGQTMHQNHEAGLWALHVWIGRENPDGLFADWNPKVSCEFAS
jgi:hypothetical protein